MLEHKISELLKHNPEDIIKSSLVIELLRLYSLLYLNGAQPGGCEKCLRKYYNQIKNNGMEQAKIVEDIQKRTLIPAWNGLKYVPRCAKHFNSVNINDSIACDALLDGNLRESDFKKLPVEWIKYKEEEKEELKKKEDSKKTKEPETKEKLKNEDKKK